MGLVELALRVLLTLAGVRRLVLRDLVARGGLLLVTVEGGHVILVRVRRGFVRLMS